MSVGPNVVVQPPSAPHSLAPSLPHPPLQSRRDQSPQAGATLNRLFTLSFDREKANAEDRTIELSFSSDEPVDRYWGVEILDHGAGAADLSRLKSGGPLLLEHDRRSQIGVIEDAWLDAKTAKCRARVRFGKSALATEVWNDVLDGIRMNVSCNYDLDEVIRESEKDGKPTYRVRKWTPNEISIVSIPADTTVGVGRGEEQPQPPTPDPMKRSFLPSILLDPAAGPTAGGGGGAPTAPPSQSRAGDLQPDERNRIVETERKSERERQTQIRALYDQHQCATVDTKGEILNDHLNNGRSLQDIQNWILQNRYKAKPILLDPNVGMSETEVRSYSLLRALNRLAQQKPLDGLELEASLAVAKRSRRDPEGFFIPHDVTSRSMRDAQNLTSAQMLSLFAGLAQTRALSSGVSSAGGYLVGTNVLTTDMIELLRNKVLVATMGARMLTGLQGDIAIPRQTGGATAYWLSETSTVTRTDQSFGQLALTPHRLGAATAYTKQLLAQSSLAIEAFVREDIMTVLAIEKDRAAITGLNANGEPLGLMNVNGIGGVTFGAAATRAKAIEFQSDVATVNASRGALAYLSTPATAAKWMGIAEATNTAEWLWKGNIDQGVVVGRPAFSTNQVPGDKVIYGNWNDLILADWDGIDVVVDPYTLATQGQVQIVIHILTDNGLRQAGSFSVSSDSGAQ